MPDYKRLMDEQEKQVKAGQTKEKAEKQVELLTEELKNIVGRQKDIQMRLKLLADIDIDLTTAEHTLEAVNTVYQRFLGKKGFIAAKDACLAEQAKIREEEKHLELLIKEQERADIFLKEQKFNFYQSQAFNLAKELQGKMQTVKELICPVCGQITANDERFKQHLAIFDHQSLVTKEEVEKAEIAFENSRQKAETHSNELQNRILTLNNYVKVFSERVLDAVKNLSASFPQSVKAGLEAAFILTDNHLNECQSWVGELLQEAQMNVSRYRAQKNQKTNLERETVDLEQKQEQLNNKLNEIKRIQTECEKALEVSGAIVQQLSEKLVYKNRQEAENKMLIIQNERNQLLSEVNTSIANFTKADNALTGAQGRLEVIKKKLTELKEKGEEYSVALEKRLEAYSFADEEAVLEEVTVDGQQLDSASPWLTLTQNRLTDYEKETELLKKQIESLTKDTAGKTLVDLQEIENKITELTGMIDGELASREKNLAGLIDNHAKVLANVKIKRRKLLKSDKAYRILKNLAGIATGDISNQGKIDFDRYIKGEIFREVLRFANIRLDKMTGGTRELVHRIEGDRANAKAGLDLDIYDAETGTRRSDTSLSGGESFMASLSLALGLSDVVKSRIGGMKIESLFIDEGFGTLDDDKLDRAVEVLNDLTEGDCLVGVISHVGKLEESIAQKILVKKTAGKGSYVKSII